MNVWSGFMTLSLWNATQSFSWTSPIQNSRSSIYLQGRIFLPKYDKKSCSKPASVDKWYSLSIDTRSHDKSLSSTNALSTDEVNSGHEIRVEPNFLTAVPQLIARITPATPLRKLLCYVWFLNLNMYNLCNWIYITCLHGNVISYLPAYSTDHFLKSGMNNPAIRGSSTVLNHCNNLGFFAVNWASKNLPSNNVFEDKLIKQKDDHRVSPNGSINNNLNFKG